MSKYFFTALALVFCLFSCNVFANVSLYQVEVLAFAYESPQSSAEIWPDVASTVDDANAVDLSSFTGVVDAPYQKLPASFFHLNGEASMLAKNGAYRILMHEAWLQPIVVSTPSRAPKVHVVDAANVLDGTLALSRSNYFDLQANFIYKGGARNVQLNTMERLRVNELFYLDHPYFGMLVLIKPYR